MEKICVDDRRSGKLLPYRCKQVTNDCKRTPISRVYHYERKETAY